MSPQKSLRSLVLAGFTHPSEVSCRSGRSVCWSWLGSLPCLVVGAAKRHRTGRWEVQLCNQSIPDWGMPGGLTSWKDPRDPQLWVAASCPIISPTKFSSGPVSFLQELSWTCFYFHLLCLPAFHPWCLGIGELECFHLGGPHSSALWPMSPGAWAFSPISWLLPYPAQHLGGHRQPSSRTAEGPGMKPSS